MDFVELFTRRKRRKRDTEEATSMSLASHSGSAQFQASNSLNSHDMNQLSSPSASARTNSPIKDSRPKRKSREVAQVPQLSLSDVNVVMSTLDTSEGSPVKVKSGLLGSTESRGVRVSKSAGRPSSSSVSRENVKRSYTMTLTTAAIFKMNLLQGATEICNYQAEANAIRKTTFANLKSRFDGLLKAKGWGIDGVFWHDESIWWNREIVYFRNGYADGKLIKGEEFQLSKCLKLILICMTLILNGSSFTYDYRCKRL